MIREFWRLSEAGEHNLGLACTDDGLLLGRTPLIERWDERFIVREQRAIGRLLSRAYQADLVADRLMPGLATVAAALNANDPCLARIAAVHLRIPDLPDQAARDGMEAEDILLKSADWNPALHPRAGTPPNPGWFASTAGSNDKSSPIRTAQNDDPTWRSDASPGIGQDWVRLPAGHQRIDELADFVEWMANAKPEDEQAIRAEIKRYFYDAGDQGSAAALNSALTVLLRPGITQEDRQKLLNGLDVFTRADPAEYSHYRDWTTGAALLSAGLPPAAAGETAAAEGAGTAAAAIASPAEAWKLGWAARGNYFNERLGANLPATFQTIDIFENGVATSIKSIDLNAATYQDAARLTHRLNDYINNLAEYNGSRLGKITVRPEDIASRSLSIAVPEGSMTSVQKTAIEAAGSRANDLGITLIVTPL